MNEELISSAVSFLKDPNVQDSPLTKKVEFLESKGLNQQEIEEALKRVSNPGTSNSGAGSSDTSNSGTTNNTYQSSQQLNRIPPIDYYNAPTIPERSWKDYFIMATTTVGVGYGLYQVVSRYLLPNVIPPSISAIEKDKQTIDEEFLKIDKVLEQLSQDQKTIKEENESKVKEIDIVIDNVNDFLSKYNKDKLKFDDDLRLMKLEIDNLSNSIEKNMGFTKNNIKDELSQINEELQSLKQLIKVKNGTTNSERKLTPVSSIPSASEILKRAKAAKAEKEKEEAKAKEKANEKEKEKEKEFKSSPSSTSTIATDRPGLVGTTSVDNITAAGIPAWQMKHKEEEMKKEEANKQLPDSKPAIPSWQLNATDDAADQKVKDTLKTIGVPAWQLNNNSESTETT